MAAKKPPLGQEIDAIWQMREAKRDLEAKAKKISAEIEAAEDSLLARLDEEKMDKATGSKATVSISKVDKGNILDWDELCKYVKKTGAFQVFQRRLSDPAVRELFTKGKNVPGVEIYTARKLNILTIKKES